MQFTPQRHDLTRFFAPRWTWRSVLLAGAVSLSVYLLLPYLEMLSVPPNNTLSVRSVTTAEMAPPAPPPRRVQERVARPEPNAPKPKMQPLRRRLVPMQAAMNLSMAIGDMGGDFSVDFEISADVLGDQIKQLVFEIGDLDEPPRPLARLDPIYPPQASMRKIDGVVVVEFVVTADGTVRDIVVVSSKPGDMFTAAAIRAIERWRFTPGTKHGEAVATRVRQKVEFKN